MKTIDVESPDFFYLMTDVFEQSLSIRESSFQKSCAMKPFCSHKIQNGYILHLNQLVDDTRFSSENEKFYLTAIESADGLCNLSQNVLLYETICKFSSDEMSNVVTCQDFARLLRIIHRMSLAYLFVPRIYFASVRQLRFGGGIQYGIVAVEDVPHDTFKPKIFKYTLLIIYFQILLVQSCSYFYHLDESTIHYKKVPTVYAFNLPWLNETVDFSSFVVESDFEIKFSQIEHFLPFESNSFYKNMETFIDSRMIGKKRRDWLMRIFWSIEFPHDAKAFRALMIVIAGYLFDLDKQSADLKNMLTDHERCLNSNDPFLWRKTHTEVLLIKPQSKFRNAKEPIIVHASTMPENDPFDESDDDFDDNEEEDESDGDNDDDDPFDVSDEEEVLSPA